MNPGKRPPVSLVVAVLVIAPLTLATGGCFERDLASEPMVFGQPGDPPPSPERVAALIDIRQRANAADEQPYPDAFQAEQTARLSARPEPRPASEGAAIEAELAAIAELQRVANTPEERAALQARADALRLKADEDQAGRLRP